MPLLLREELNPTRVYPIFREPMMGIKAAGWMLMMMSPQKYHTEEGNIWIGLERGSPTLYSRGKHLVAKGQMTCLYTNSSCRLDSTMCVSKRNWNIGELA